MGAAMKGARERGCANDGREGILKPIMYKWSSICMLSGTRNRSRRMGAMVRRNTNQWIMWASGQNPVHRQTRCGSCLH